MGSGEFVMLQEALVWMFYPVLTWLVVLLAAGGIIASIWLNLSIMWRHMTRRD